MEENQILGMKIFATWFVLSVTAATFNLYILGLIFLAFGVILFVMLVFCEIEKKSKKGDDE